MRRPTPLTIPRTLAALLGLTLASLAVAQAPRLERPKPNFAEDQVPAYTLPDPLVGLDGSAVRDARDWTSRRRAELIGVFSQTVYGVTPSSPLPGLHMRLVSVESGALGGKAVRKLVTIWLTARDDGPQLHLLVYQPVAASHRPWPVFLGLNYNGNESIVVDPGVALSTTWMRDSTTAHIVNHRTTEGTRGVSAAQWQVTTLLARGYAVATLYYGEICPDSEAGLAEGVGRLFPGAGAVRRPDEWGALGQWAWGLSRAMDYLASDSDLDPARVAVLGHSRLGKAALWAGAQDPRFALVISNESGCEGAKLGRRIYGQTPTDISIAFPYWFCPAFTTVRGHEAAMPVDQHELLALVAPRLLYVASAEGDRNSDPKGEFLGLKGVEPVYALFGKAPLPAASPPPVDSPITGTTLGYHERSGSHDITSYDWTQYLAFADQNLK